MARVEFNYKVSNVLDNHINREVGKRMAVNGGIRVLKNDIIGEIAKYCEVKPDAIKRVKRGIMTPSLPLALKIAEYFSVKVEDIFKIS